MNQFFAYIRVSTARQGEFGVSLDQQRDAIERYSQRNNLKIAQWFEEQETAAKSGRPLFTRMIKLLQRGKVAGVIIHKIDRSARNLKDWADLGELIDKGVEVHFANESLDLRSRGGRLSADIQAVVASDYIRNLREETKKGFYGRLKQGLYPMPAPVGYINVGKGQPKQPDPQIAPLVRTAFELYGTGRFGFKELRKELNAMGFRGRSGKPISLNGLTKMLNNTFYVGLIHISKTNETYEGAHEPIISKALFDRVQDILHGKLSPRTTKHDFLFRRRLSCRFCEYSLIGETHKGYIYYRCQSSGCPTTSIREEYADSAFLKCFAMLDIPPVERRCLLREIQKMKIDDNRNQENLLAALNLQSAQLDERLNRLTDAYIERLIDKELFEQRKNALLMERTDIREKIKKWQSGTVTVSDLLAQILERSLGAYLAYKLGNPEEKRDVVDSLTSNRIVEQKSLTISLLPAFREIANRYQFADGSPRRDVPRTCSRLLQSLLQLVHRQKENLSDGSTFPYAA